MDLINFLKNKSVILVGSHPNVLNYKFGRIIDSFDVVIRFNCAHTNNIEEYIGIADLVFISVNTPTKTKGLGAGQASDLKWVEASARQVAKFAKGHTIVVEKSTLPVKTAEVIMTILENSKLSEVKSDNVTFDVLSNPEFLS